VLLNYRWLQVYQTESESQSKKAVTVVMQRKDTKVIPFFPASFSLQLRGLPECLSCLQVRTELGR